MRSLTALALALAVAPLAACSAPPAFLAAETGVVIDGVIEEWPVDAAAVADEHYLYFRTAVRNDRFAIQASDRSLALWLDADANPDTGWRPDSPQTPEDLGVDLRVAWSLPKDRGGPGRGVVLDALAPDGSATRLDRHDADFTNLPTYASAWYEARIARTLNNDTLPIEGLRSQGRARGTFVLTNAQGRVIAASDPFEVDLPPAAPKPPAETPLPATEPGDLRVVSFNILRNALEKNPAPFARVLRALRPDVILFQEWDDATPDIAREWLATHVDAATDWHAVSNPGAGVVIASRFPANPVDLGDLRIGDGGSTRAVAARIFTPNATVLATSVHLKCCGGADGPEDRLRMDQTRLINARLRDALAQSRADLTIIGGDLNLVGTRPPLDLLRAGLDAGEDLAVATPLVLGDSVASTWSDPGNDFGPGQLDFIVFSRSTHAPARTFVLDTARLADGPLAAAGLERTDSSASDHRPVVLDLRPR